MLSFITPFEILANRFIHSFIFALVLIFFTSNKSDFLSECKFIFSNHKRILALIAASLSITTNWGLYIWAVNSNHIISASLGYYINPLVSVLLGIIFLKEKLNLAQGIAFFLSALGVLNMVWGAGGFPWISLVLAFSFGFYGLIKKILPVSAISSIAIETAMIMPIMLLYEFYLASKSASVYQNISPGYFLLLLGSGIVTATPLMLFSAAARLLSLKALGFLQSAFSYTKRPSPSPISYPSDSSGSDLPYFPFHNLVQITKHHNCRIIKGGNKNEKLTHRYQRLFKTKTRKLRLCRQNAIHSSSVYHRICPLFIAPAAVRENSAHKHNGRTL